MLARDASGSYHSLNAIPPRGDTLITSSQRRASTLRRRRQPPFVLGLFLVVCISVACADTTPLASIRSLLDLHRPVDHVVLRGTVTFSGKELVVQDQTGAVAVSPGEPVSLSLGDEVEVQGELRQPGGLPVVEHASVRTLWAGSTPLPLSITPDEAAEGAYNGMLVTIEGRLVKLVRLADGGLRLTMESGNQLFTGTLDASAAPPEIHLQRGETLRCTGVLAVSPAENTLESGTFLILLRSGVDLHLLAGPPWWTPAHMLLLFLFALVLVWLAYRIHLRNVHARFALLMEERSRIAREIHDTLAQGYAGIALQLQGARSAMGEQSAPTNDHLSVALQMVRRSRAEAHRSIATLRTLHSQEELSTMLEKLLRQLTQPAHLELTVTMRGTPIALADETVSELLRIAQEATANTVEHARASHVAVIIAYTPAFLLMDLRDDGCGFDPAIAASVESGHFGITGMRERGAHIGAQFDLTSGAQGTHLCLKLPLAAPSTSRWIARLPLPFPRLRRSHV